MRVGHVVSGLTIAATLGGAPLASGGCTGVFGLAVSSVEVTTPEAALDDELLTTVMLAFLPVDVFMTIMFATDADASISYLELHRQAIRVALVRGDGPFVRDLAQVLALPEELLAPLGEALRDARPMLEPILAEQGPIDVARARTFMERLLSVIAADERLAPALEMRRLAPGTGVTYGRGGGDSERG